MNSKIVWILRRISSQIWFRVSTYGIVAVATVFLASLVGDMVPSEVSDRISDGTAQGILSIIASSMLVVATFALSAMVQAYAAATSSASPRATKILIDDAFSQNVLSTFLGAFVFSMVGILALSLQFYSRGGEFVLVVASSIVILLVIVSFFGWLDHLANLVRLGEVSMKVCSRAEAILRARAEAPRLGGIAPDDRCNPGHPIYSEQTGYVRHVDPYKLQNIAKAADGAVRITSMPGILVDPKLPLLWTSWQADEQQIEKLRNAFSIGPERSFDQDPRFCVEVLTEIGTRALSPGINDPGTAISIVSLQQGLLTHWHEMRMEYDGTPSCDRVMAPDLDASELFEDAFGPLLRDGAGILEFGMRLQRTLHRLGQLESEEFREAAEKLSRLGLAHSDKALPIHEERTRLREFVAELNRSGV
ncbi:DUF2254 domain-containing protein [Amaricoccus macauensis]|uniref:DUF2254 domain-containing protein n=1 Tax=Amaricoccus macauensis TaxID=57001 RepID=UPI003C7E2D9C